MAIPQGANLNLVMLFLLQVREASLVERKKSTCPIFLASSYLLPQSVRKVV